MVTFRNTSPGRSGSSLKNGSEILAGGKVQPYVAEAVANEHNPHGQIAFDELFRRNGCICKANAGNKTGAQSSFSNLNPRRAAAVARLSVVD
jgi:hypothetical protein